MLDADVLRMWNLIAVQRGQFLVLEKVTSFKTALVVVQTLHHL